MQSTILKKNNSERPVDALAEKQVLLTHSVTDNLKSRHASASKLSSFGSEFDGAIRFYW